MAEDGRAPVAGEKSDGYAIPFGGVPVEITVSVGRARPVLRDLLELQVNAVLPLDQGIDDPVELYIGDRLIARGELQQIEDDPNGRLAVRLTEVARTAGTE